MSPDYGLVDGNLLIAECNDTISSVKNKMRYIHLPRHCNPQNYLYILISQKIRFTKQSLFMKITLVLFFVCAIGMWSCTKKADVQCFCQGGNNETSGQDWGHQKNPSARYYAAKCDTFGAQNNLDSCYVLLLGK